VVSMAAHTESVQFMGYPKCRKYYPVRKDVQTHVLHGDSDPDGNGQVDKSIWRNISDTPLDSGRAFSLRDRWTLPRSRGVTPLRSLDLKTTHWQH